MIPTQFVAVTEWLPEAMILITREGIITGANRAACQLLGIPALPTEPFSIHDALHESSSDLRGYLRDAARTRQPMPGRLTLRGDEGAPLPFRTTARLVQPAGPDRRALLLVHLLPKGGAHTQFKLLTERVEQLSVEIQRRQRAEEERRTLETQMLQTQKLESLGVLAGGIAHDFNNLLTSIIGYCDLARGEVAPAAPAAAFLDEAVNGARRAAELTQQMLAYAGKGRFIVEPVVLSSLVDDIARLLEVSISKRCVLRYHLLAELPACQADATQMRQVIMNLIINASDAIGDRSGVISLTTGVAWCDQEYLTDNHVDDDLPEGLYVHLEVADTGVGMTAETRRRIFDPFFTTKFTGRGLGLAAVLGIVRSHGGSIRVYSEIGRGTSFKILLPAIDQTISRDATGTAAEPEWNGRGTVLVVDDEESIRGLTKHMLRKVGFDVITASDGREALELFRADPSRIALVLLDLTMPHLDGAATFRELRRIQPGVRAILMSGYNEQTVTAQFAGKGIAGFIQKPFRVSQLRDAVQAALGEPVAPLAERAAQRPAQRPIETG